MPDNITDPRAHLLGVSLTIGGNARNAVHVVTDAAGVTVVTDLLAALSGSDSVTVDVVAVFGKAGGARATVRRYAVPAASVNELVERTLQEDR